MMIIVVPIRWSPATLVSAAAPSIMVPPIVAVAPCVSSPLGGSVVGIVAVGSLVISIIAITITITITRLVGRRPMAAIYFPSMIAIVPLSITAAISALSKALGPTKIVVAVAVIVIVVVIIISSTTPPFLVFLFFFSVVIVVFLASSSLMPPIVLVLITITVTFIIILSVIVVSMRYRSRLALCSFHGFAIQSAGMRWRFIVSPIVFLVAIAIAIAVTVVVVVFFSEQQRR
jgi:hypothetical protein